MTDGQWDMDNECNVTLSPLLGFVVSPAQLVVIA